MGGEEYETRLRRSHGELFEEASRFYMGRGDVYATLRRLARRLDDEGIPYALVGGMALAVHGFVRMTQDVAILLTAEGLAAFRERCVGVGYAPALPGAAKVFRDTETGVRIEILTTGEYPGDGKPKPVAFPDPCKTSIEREGLRVLTPEALVELKLASGMSARHRLRDLADVQDLIVALKLPLEFGERLDPSVREAFRDAWHAAQAPGGPSG
jgi:hypothetical protein